jgi:hypothetical protein
VILRIEVIEILLSSFSSLSQLPKTVAVTPSATKSPFCEKVNSSTVAPANDGLYVEHSAFRTVELP